MNLMINFVIHVHAFSTLSIIIITFGLVWLCFLQQKWRFIGVGVILCGVLLGILHQTPDILVSAYNVAFKENDGLLYSLSNRNRNFITRTWASQNGQDKMLNYRKYTGDSRLKYYDSSYYIYSYANQSVLFAYKEIDILKYCNSVDLIVQLSNFKYQDCNTKVIKYSDLEKYGTQSIWFTYNDIIVKLASSNRPWDNETSNGP